MGMGLLGTALLAGAGHGMNVLGGALQKSAEKSEDEALAERRMQVLADIQRQSANRMRSDEFSFRNDPSNVEAEIATAARKGEAGGMLARSESLLNETDDKLRAAKRSNADEDAADATERELKVLDAKSKDPRYTAAQRQDAKLAAERLRQEVDIRTQGAIRVVQATEEARAGAGAYSNRDGSMKLPPGVKAAHDSLGETEKELMKAITKAKAEVGGWDPKNNPGQQELLYDLADTRRAQQRLLTPYLPQGQGVADESDPYRVVPKKPEKPAETVAPNARREVAARVASSDSLAGLGREQIRAKRSEIESELKRWQGRSGAEARVAELKTLLERIDNGQY